MVQCNYNHSYICLPQKYGAQHHSQEGRGLPYILPPPPNISMLWDQTRRLTTWLRLWYWLIIVSPKSNKVLFQPFSSMIVEVTPLYPCTMYTVYDKKKTGGLCMFLILRNISIPEVEFGMKFLWPWAFIPKCFLPREQKYKLKIYPHIAYTLWLPQFFVSFHGCAHTLSMPANMSTCTSQNFAFTR